MEARNRRLPEWFMRVQSQQIELPRFQRMEAWTPNQVSGLLTTVLRGLPAGAALTLEVGDHMPFVSRTLSGAPSSDERVVELLLDGQQRLTALWRALNDDYPDRLYFVEINGLEEGGRSEGPTVLAVKTRKGATGRLPAWVDDPKRCWERSCIPARLLHPGDRAEEVNGWIREVVEDDIDEFQRLSQEVAGLRSKVSDFNLPFLSLPPATPRHVALDVFIKMNTSAVTLTPFDILVAQVEATTGESLHDLVGDLSEENRFVKDYRDPRDLVLDTAALIQDRTPNQSGYWALDLHRLVREWPRLRDGLEGLVAFLSEQGVYDKQRLPSVAVLPVVAALLPILPTDPDRRGNAGAMLRKYFWRASFTDRYESAAASKALNDYRGMRAVILEDAPQSGVPLFNENDYPFPTVEQILDARWPKNVGIVPRGILALSAHCGARDIADDSKISREQVRLREYHHLFPHSLLRDAGVADQDSFRALNCALITWRTNRKISNKRPVDYLREHADASDLGEEILAYRLRTHLIPYQHLSALESPGELDPERVKMAYESFLKARATVVLRALRQLWRGAPVDDLSPLFDELNQDESKSD